MKHLEARPWLVALVTVTAALATVSTGSAAVVDLAPLDVVVPVPPALLFLSTAMLGLALLALKVWRARGESVTARIDPVASDPSAIDPAPGSATATAAATAAAAMATSATGPGFMLELDLQGRIARCQGTAAGILADDLTCLPGHSVLKLIPTRVRAGVVEAVRRARAAPGEAIQLPLMRLQTLATDGQASSTPPVRLTLRGRADGGVTVDGRIRTPGGSGRAGLESGRAGLESDRAGPDSGRAGPESDRTVLSSDRAGSRRRRAAGSGVDLGSASADLGAGDDRFSRVFHSSPDAILIYRRRDGTIIDFNQGFTQVLGYTREEAIGQLTSDLDLWIDPQERDALLETFNARRNVTDAEIQLRRSDGQPVPVELSVRFIELDGELCVLCIARDISRRRQAELAARSSEEKFSRIFSQSPDGILILRRRDLAVRDANQAFLRGSGFTAEELIGQQASIFDSVFTESGDMAQIVELLDREGRVANREMRLHSKSGREMSALFSGLLTDIDGEPSLLCIIKDVTDLRHMQEQLRRSEERFRGAFENAPIGILLLDPQGHIFQANRFATELLNYPEGSIDNMHVSRLVPADERGDLKEQLERLVRGNEPALRSERRMLCGDGLEIWTNCHVVLQRGRDGEPLYSILQIADITEMKTSQRRMERLAFYDTLTELANRRLFNDRLQQAVEHCRRHETRAALLYLDLDQFKRVNDTLGHESGDALLKEVADRLLRCVRKEDTVGRPGGDEFTILLYEVDAPSHAGHVAEKILRELERPITISGHQLVVTTSIGITIVPDDGEEPNALTKNADLAMYRAKEKGRNNYQFFSEDLNTNAVHRLRTEHELRRALERSEFELHYQPNIRLSDRTIVGVECLVRWNHPERGMVPPDEFIGIAEETGAIVEIGNWVIQEACAAGRLMTEQHGAPLSIAVNISPRQFRDPNLVETIRQSLRQAHLDPGCLEVEITETMLMEDVGAAAEIVQRLHRLGIRLAIDDFGTGYSSLNYLKKFPISTVKVDRSFVTDIPESSDDMEITAAVIAMAHRLRMQVVAEGVETHAQLEFLTEQGCDYAQGYLFSRALPLQEIRKLLGSEAIALLRNGA